MAEQWRPVPGWPCEASDTGRVRSVYRGLPYVLARGRDRKGYPQVSAGGRTARVHKLVALAWLPKPKRGKTQVRHLDGDKDNCAPWNLKWGDQHDQEQDKRHAGTRSRAKRGTNGSERNDRVKRGSGRNGSEIRGKERNRTGASGARVPQTSRTFQA
jgi:hypothetical protein